MRAVSYRWVNPYRALYDYISIIFYNYESARKTIARFSAGTSPKPKISHKMSSKQETSLYQVVPGRRRGGSFKNPARGPRGPELAVSMPEAFSPLRRREGPRPLPPTTAYHQKVPRFTVFFAVPIFRLLWPKMGQHGPT